MLEEYLCLGGNEVVNNARAYGYATTAGCPLNWYRCEPCESLHDAVNDWVPGEWRPVEHGRNIFANTRFVLTDSTTVARRNYNPNPRMRTSTTGWTKPAAVTLTATPDGIECELTAPLVSGQSWINNDAAITSAPGQWWIASMEVEVPADAAPVTVAVAVHSYGDDFPVATTPNVVINPGETVRLTATPITQTGASTTGVRSILYLRQNQNTGDRVIVRDAITEQAQNFLGYFDGDNLPPTNEEGLTAVWTGTADNSESILRGSHPEQTWANIGEAVTYVTPDGSRTMLYFGIPTVLGFEPITGQMPIPGETATILVRARASRDMTVGLRIGTGVDSREDVDLTTDYEWFRVIVPVGTISDGRDVGFVFDAPEDGDLIDVTHVLIAPGAYSDAWFDGDSVDVLEPGDQIFWLGFQYQSVSVWERETLITPGRSEEPPYTYGNINLAPWYDAEDPDMTGRFYGVWAVEVTGVESSTREATVSQSLLDGGVAGLVRHASREIRVRALLAAQGEDALEYGLTWLDAALATTTCGSHGNACGAVDLTFFAACPEPDEDNTDTIVEESFRLRRHLHNVTVISGPLITDHLHSSDDKHFAYIVEWTMVAGTPWVFGDTQEIALEPSTPVVVQDVPYNLVPYPSMELAGDPVLVATNYSQNPSVETDATDWSASAVAVSGTSPAAFFTSERSTEIHAGEGTASYRARILGNNGSTVVTDAEADMIIEHEVTLSPATGQRYSVTIWGAMFVISGDDGSELQSLTAEIEWLNGGSTLRTDTIASTVSEFGGRVFALRSITPPATTDNAIVRLIGRVTWSSSAVAENNSDIRMFADTVALTTP